MLQDYLFDSQICFTYDIGTYKVALVGQERVAAARDDTTVCYYIQRGLLGESTRSYQVIVESYGDNNISVSLYDSVGVITSTSFLV